jgi:uncharacterized protein (DUF1778 family)
MQTLKAVRNRTTRNGATTGDDAVVRLSGRDYKRLAASIESPPTPPAALKRAMRKHREACRGSLA